MLIKTLGYFIKNVSEKAYQVLTQDDTEIPHEEIEMGLIDNHDHNEEFGIFIKEDSDDKDNKPSIKINFE